MSGSGNIAVPRVSESRNFVWDVNLQDWVAMQQPILNAGSVTISGAVDQGTGGSSAWKVDGSAVVQPTSSKTDLTPSAPTAATVGATSSQVVAANSARKGLVLVNTSNNRISLGLGAAAVLDSGMTLNPNGGYWEMDEYTFDLGAVFAIAPNAGNNLAIQEFTT